MTTPGRRVPNGEAADRVARNIAAMRGIRWHTHHQLGKDLAAAGRPIPELGIARLLRGERRIDVDDLIAFAKVLGMPATDLLFGEVTISVTRRDLDDT